MEIYNELNDRSGIDLDSFDEEVTEEIIKSMAEIIQEKWRTLMGEPCLTMPYAYEIEWPTDSEGSTEAILCKPWEDSDSQKDFDVANINGFDITPLYREKDILNPKCKCGCGAPSSLECYEIPED